LRKSPWAYIKPFPPHPSLVGIRKSFSEVRDEVSCPGVARGGTVGRASIARKGPTFLRQRHSALDGIAEKGGKTVAGEILGTDSQHKQMQEVLCQEYVLQGQRIIYRIRPVDQKHPVLLPVGESVDFRIHKDKLYLRDPEGDQKERQYIVLSMQTRPNAKDANDESGNR
jgi:hypothetical protein